MYKTFPLKERVEFMNKLSFLLSSGIPFTECLHFIIQKECNKNKKEYLKNVVSKIHGGSSISKSFDTSLLLIDKVSLRIIKNAEATGSLSKSCHSLSLVLEEKLSNRNRLMGAMLYPFCIIIFAFILTTILLFFVFPKIIPLVQSSGAKLPLSTKILLFLFNFLKQYGVFLVFCVSLIFASFIILFKKNKTFNHGCFRGMLLSPISGLLIRLFKISAFAKETSLFLETGYSLVEILDFAYEYESNPLYKQGLKSVSGDIKKGIKFSKSLENFSFLFGQDLPIFVALGEESGRLSKSLLQVGLFYDQEIKNIEKKFFVLLEPVLMIVLGIIVGFIALSLITPIYSITSSLNSSTP